MYNKKLIQSLSDKFAYEFVDSINIIDYDYNWASLYHRFDKLKKEKWAANEKILVQHSDTEFFFNGSGLSIYNFNQVIKSLDIDPAVFVILTNHRNSTREWLSYCDHTKNQFHVIETPLTELITFNTDSIDPLGSQCQHRLGSMMGLLRGHRVLLAKFLVSNNLLDQNLISINLKSISQTTAVAKTTAEHNRSIPTFLTTDPTIRCNENWKYSSQLIDLYDAVPEVPVILNKKLSGYNSASWIDCPWYKDIFVDLVTESVYHYPYAFISEKTVRPIRLGRPFVLVGAAGTIKWLHELGFRTFSDYWDEDYDLVTDPNDRFVLLCNLVKHINTFSIRDCQKMLKSMQNVLTHNQQNYLNWINNGLS